VARIVVTNWRLPMLLSLCMLLAGCGPTLPMPTEDPPTEPRATETAGPPTQVNAFPTASPIQPSHEPSECLEDFQRRELREVPGSPGGGARYTLSAEDLTMYLSLMGIDSICLPVAFGAPFLNVDWNNLDDPPIAIGRMVSIGFEALNDGTSGWGRGYLVFSTCDFQAGSMHETFAAQEDLQAIRSQTMPDTISADGIVGFVRYLPGFRWQTQAVSKTYVFPFDDYYLAAVLILGSYDPAEIDNVVRQMEEGHHPDLIDPHVPLMDLLVSSIQFR